VNDSPLNVVFFSDTAMLPGLHVALWSLWKSYRSTQPLRVTVFCDDVADAEKRLLEQSHQAAGPVGELLISDVIIPDLPGANSLNGNRTAYGRVFLAELLPDADHVIYLDCDLIVSLSIELLAQRLDASQCTLAAGGVQPRYHSLDRQLYERAGLEMKGMAFNSGVLGLNLAQWRAEGRSAEIQRTAARFRGSFASADQALLNTVFAGDFTELPPEFNWAMYPSSPPEFLGKEAIVHFVGSPKPWDVFGSQLHRSYSHWASIYRNTALGGRSPRRYSSLRRTARISKAIWNAWRAKAKWRE